MKIAVASMKDVGDAQSGLAGKCLDLAEDFGDLRTRDDADLHDIVRTDATDGSECTPATLPEQRSLLFVFRPANLQRTRGASHLDRCSGCVLDFSQRAVDIHEQNGSHIGPIDPGGSLRSNDGQT